MERAHEARREFWGKHSTIPWVPFPVVLLYTVMLLGLLYTVMLLGDQVFLFYCEHRSLWEDLWEDIFCSRWEHMWWSSYLSRPSSCDTMCGRFWLHFRAEKGWLQPGLPAMLTVGDMIAT